MVLTYQQTSQYRNMEKRLLPRNLKDSVLQDLPSKIVLIAGPRQCGKTTFAKSLSSSADYLNFDASDDRQRLLQKKWNRQRDLIIFDEIHRMPRWKSWLKGIFDTEGIPPQIIVTGSARLDAFKKAGDSLAGRHFYYRLHPFDLKEVATFQTRFNEDKALEVLMKCGGYPEPFLRQERAFYNRWKQAHLDVIIKQDLRDLGAVSDIGSIQVLIELLRQKVGSPLSINALATDLSKDPKTVQRWLNLLESLFVVFKVTPYSKDISRAVKKEPKYYFYDCGFVSGEEPQKLENIVACSLLKEAHYQTDTNGRPYDLHFLKVKGGQEIDFLLRPRERGEPAYLIEVKLSDDNASPNFKLFRDHFKNARCYQLVKNLKREHSTALGVHVKKLASWLSTFSL